MRDAPPVSAQPAAPQPTAKPAAAPPPPIRRWLDVQQLSFGGRFRWFENSADKLISSNLQWQPQIRARFLFDKGAKYSINGFASSGLTFPSSWNNTGGGLGTFQGAFNVKQLFVQAEPMKGLEFQAGGLHMNRGEMAEHITYDNDAFIEGERVTVRPAKGWLKQVAVTTGYFGDYREPNVFKRFDRMDEWNYGQALVGVRPGQERHGVGRLHLRRRPRHLARGHQLQAAGVGEAVHAGEVRGLPARVGRRRLGLQRLGRRAGGSGWRSPAA